MSSQSFWARSSAAASPRIPSKKSWRILLSKRSGFAAAAEAGGELEGAVGWVVAQAARVASRRIRIPTAYARVAGSKTPHPTDGRNRRMNRQCTLEAAAKDECVLVLGHRDRALEGETGARAGDRELANIANTARRVARSQRAVELGVRRRSEPAVKADRAVEQQRGVRGQSARGAGEHRVHGADRYAVHEIDARDEV